MTHKVTELRTRGNVNVNSNNRCDCTPSPLFFSFRDSHVPDAVGLVDCLFNEAFRGTEPICPTTNNTHALVMKPSGSWVKMDNITHTQSNDGMLKNSARVQREDIAHDSFASNSAPAEPRGEPQPQEEARAGGMFGRKRKSNIPTYSHANFKVYKRRWFGLGQLVLLNIVVSWDVRTSFLLCPLHGHDLSMLSSELNLNLNPANLSHSG